MREFTFSLTYPDGASTLMDAVAEHPSVRVRSEVCFATESNMWRLDRLTGRPEAVDAVADVYTDPDQCNECLDEQRCDTRREYEVLDASPGSRLIYTRRHEIHGCYSIPYLAAAELEDGVVFEAVREGSTYTWRVLMPEARNAGALFDTIEAEIGDRVTLELEQFSEPRGWRPGRSGRHQLPAEQARAIETAIERGYYGSPRDVTLEDLATELGIPRSTLRYRLRQAESSLLEAIVESPA